MGNHKTLFRRLGYVGIIALFALVSLLYFAPQLKGKVMDMHDVTSYYGMCQDIIEHRAEYDEDPQWAGRMFGGMPSYLINFQVDATLVKYIDRYAELWWRPASLIFMTMLGFWLMLLMFGVNPWLGAVFSIAYGLSSYTIIIVGAGHITKTVALAYAPMLVGAVFYTLRRNMWIGAGLTALFAALTIYANHLQMTYYFLFILVALWINEGVQAYKGKLLTKFTKVTLLLALAGTIGVLANLANLWYVHEHTEDTMRGGSELSVSGGVAQSENGLALDYATAWSYGKIESFNMFVPGLMGGASQDVFANDGEVADALAKYNRRQMATQLPTYWGDQPFTAGPTYIGAVMIFLAVLALFIVAKRYTYWILAVSTLAILLAWGHNLMWFTELFFYNFPLYSKFRAVSSILVIVQWSVPLLAALGVAKIWSGDYDKVLVNKAIKRSVMVTGGVALALLLFGGVLFSFSSEQDVLMQWPGDVLEAMRSERLAIMREDAFRSLIFVLLTAGFVWGFANGKIKKMVLVASLMALTCFDLIPVDMRFLPQSKFKEPSMVETKPTTADIEILKDTTLGYRVVNLSVSTFNDASTSYFHRSIGGYHAAKLRRYQDIIDRHLSKNNWDVYNMLNTKYIISADENSGALEVQLNEAAYGAAWFVNELLIVESPDQEIEALNSINPLHTAVVDHRFADQLKDFNVEVDSTATIELVDYKVNHLTYRSKSSKEGVAIFSEIFYDKGWSAWIDGVEVPYFRADYILRGAVIPAGEHTIEFKFEAPKFDILSTITLIASLIAVIGAIVATAFLLCCKKKCKK